MANAVFLHQMKHNSNTGNWDKGIVVKDEASGNYEAALQAYHAYLGAYAYGHDANTDYVACYITDEGGIRRAWEVWNGRGAEPTPNGGGE